MRTTKEILIAARELISKGWTQGCFARKANGCQARSILGEVGDATCFCIAGAVKAVAASEDEYDRCWAVLSNTIGGSAASWNDHRDRKKEEVIDMITKTINNEDITT